MKNQAVFDEFVLHASRAFFASAWADQEDESCNSCGGEILDRMPDEIDPAAIHAGRTLAMGIERMNQQTVADLMTYIENVGSGDRSETLEFFGHYAAMQAMGHGVGLADAFGDTVYETVRIPYVEFGAYSLERDYF